MKIYKIAQSTPKEITTDDCINVLIDHVRNRDDLWNKNYEACAKGLMIYKNLKDYKSKLMFHVKSKDSWKQLWEKEINNEKARLFTVEGFHLYKMIIYEVNGAFTKIEYYQSTNSTENNQLISGEITTPPILTESL